MELLYQPFLISPCGHTACFTWCFQGGD
jgi:hypothetical protein